MTDTLTDRRPRPLDGRSVWVPVPVGEHVGERPEYLPVRVFALLAGGERRQWPTRHEYADFDAAVAAMLDEEELVETEEVAALLRQLEAAEITREAAAAL